MALEGCRMPFASAVRGHEGSFDAASRIGDNRVAGLGRSYSKGSDAMAEALPELSSFSFVLAVPNLEASASYFRDALGFRLDWPDGIGWKLATRGGARHDRPLPRCDVAFGNR